MALLGGGVGGAGNPVGGSFTGPAEALQIIGDHAYAYSGKVTTVGTGSANTTLLDFTSGNYYFVGTIAAQNDEAATAEQFFDVLLNGSSIINAKWDDDSSGKNTLDFPFPIIIPAYTVVVVKCGVSGGTDVWTGQLVGRIYRTRD